VCGCVRNEIVKSSSRDKFLQWVILDVLVLILTKFLNKIPRRLDYRGEINKRMNSSSDSNIFCTNLTSIPGIVFGLLVGMFEKKAGMLKPIFLCLFGLPVW
jgi:uncharacterized membrane protein YfcA